MSSQSAATRSRRSAMTRSRPLPQEIRSAPGPPTSRSFPPRPKSLSFPPLPRMVSGPRVPLRTSALGVPTIVFALATPLRLKNAATKSAPVTRRGMRPPQAALGDRVTIWQLYYGTLQPTTPAPRRQERRYRSVVRAQTERRRCGPCTVPRIVPIPSKHRARMCGGAPSHRRRERLAPASWLVMSRAAP